MSTAASRFRKICSELGWGDPRQGLWFIGIEERQGFEPGDEETIDRLYGHQEYFRDAAVEARTRPPDPPPQEGRSRSTYVEAYIAAPLSGSTKDPSSYRELLLRLGGKVAHANLYPLGKPSAGSPLPSCYEDLFGFGAGASEMERYRDEVRRIRFPRLREAVEVLRPQAIICMGKGYWESFREALAIDSEAKAVVPGKLQVHEVRRIVMAPHFAWNRFNRSLQELTTGVLREWGVTLP